MKFTIAHECRGRIRILVKNRKLNAHQADLLYGLPSVFDGIDEVRVRSSTGSISLWYHCSRKELLLFLQGYSLKNSEQSETYPLVSIHSINEEYSNRILDKIVMRMISLVFLPVPVRTAMTLAQSLPVFANAAKHLRKRKLDIELVEAASLAIAFATGDVESAGTTAFLISLGELMEARISKRKLECFSETMALNLNTVWLLSDKEEIQISAADAKKGDHLILHAGDVVPFDGIVVDGAGMILQSGLTGNALPEAKIQGSHVLAGTILEEGELIIQVEETETSRFDSILAQIDQAERLKPELERHFVKQANGMTASMLAGALLTWLFTKDVTRAGAWLAADFVYNLKLSLSSAVLSASKTATDQGILVRGGSFLERMAAADVIVFDKTGTLTNPDPILKHVIPFGKKTEEDLIRLAACIEEHHPHIAGNAIVRAAEMRGLEHDDLHSDLEEVAAHGIITSIDGKRIVIGSYHFVLEDEKCTGPEHLYEFMHQEDHLQDRHLFLGIDGKLEGMYCLDDDLKKGAAQVLNRLREQGIQQIVLLTGDCHHSAKEAAEELAIETYYHDMLPEDKGRYVEELQAQGNIVIMVGDGINDALALSRADVGIAMNSGARVACEVAHVVIDQYSLEAIPFLRELSEKMLRRMRRTYGITKGAAAFDIMAGVTALTSFVTPGVEKAFLLALLAANGRAYPVPTDDII